MRRRAWLTPEGWYYLTVLGFIIGGAVLRGVNLLYVLAGMMLAPLVLNWRLAMIMLRGLAVRRRAPDHAVAGEPVTIELRVTNERRRWGSWLIAFRDSITRVDDPSAARVRPETLLTFAPAARESLATYRCQFPRRGRYQLGPLLVSTRFPLGLVRAYFTAPELTELIVYPALGRLHPHWNERLEAERAGEQRQRNQLGPAEGDYYGLRPWQRGDSRRAIHWRTTAKLGTLTVRQFERQHSREAAIVLDPFLDAPDDPAAHDRLERAISLAATLVSDLCERGQTRLVVAVAGAPAECLVGASSPLFRGQALEKLALVAGLPSGDLPGAVAQTAAAAGSGARIIIVSPRTEEAALAQASLANASAPWRWLCSEGDEAAELFSMT